MNKRKLMYKYKLCSTYGYLRISIRSVTPTGDLNKYKSAISTSMCISLYSLAPPLSAKAGAGGGGGGGGGGRHDKLVSKPRFRRFWKSLRLRMYLHSNMLA